jgi:hypothetical protein
MFSVFCLAAILLSLAARSTGDPLGPSPFKPRHRVVACLCEARASAPVSDRAAPSKPGARKDREFNGDPQGAARKSIAYVIKAVVAAPPAPDGLFGVRHNAEKLVDHTGTPSFLTVVTR